MNETTQDLYDVPLHRIDGTPTEMRQFEGDVLLIVNVASQCGLTPQYAGLEKLYETYKARGFKVLGFPCNQFGAQEPGSNAEIATFCSTNYAVTFPMFEKLDVNGPNRHPLYQRLIAAQPGDITWNFEKFLVDRGGNVVARFSPKTTPDDAALTGAIENELND